MSEIVHEGIWWDPRDPEKRWVGTLRFDEEEGAVLVAIVPTETLTLFPPLQTYELILGITTAGKRVTLLDCFDRSTRLGFPGVPRRFEIFANAMIEGFHCAGPNPLISVASVSFRNVEAWWGRTGFEHERSPSWPNAMVKYQQPEALPVYQCEAFSVSIRPVLSGSFERHASALKEEIRVEIKATEPRSLKDIQRLVQACGDFFSVACLAIADVEELWLIPTTADAAHRELGSFHAIPMYKKDERENLGTSELLFSFGDICDHPEATFGAWLAGAERLERVRALYLSGTYGGGYVESKLLALSQGAEAFHRRFYAGTYMEPESFAQAVLQPMRAAIPASLDPSFRDSLRMRLKFANEYSLRRRLNELVRDHESALLALTDGPSEFVDAIVDHRNDFTHHPEQSEREREAPRDREKVLRYNYLLGALLEICLLRAMAFSTEQVARFAARCDKYRRIRARFFRDAGSRASMA